MGTRADFYDGVGEEAEWLGSVAWDGYPSGFDRSLFLPTTTQGWRDRIAALGVSRDDFTDPSRGWPWPWNTSGTSDFSYWLDGDTVMVDVYGRLVPALMIHDDGYDDENEDLFATYPQTRYPDMTEQKNVRLGGPGSGLIVVEANHAATKTSPNREDEK